MKNTALPVFPTGQEEISMGTMNMDDAPDGNIAAANPLVGLTSSLLSMSPIPDLPVNTKQEKEVKANIRKINILRYQPGKERDLREALFDFCISLRLYLNSLSGFVLDYFGSSRTIPNYSSFFLKFLLETNSTDMSDISGAIYLHSRNVMLVYRDKHLEDCFDADTPYKQWGDACLETIVSRTVHKGLYGYLQFLVMYGIDAFPMKNAYSLENILREFTSWRKKWLKEKRRQQNPAKLKKERKGTKRSFLTSLYNQADSTVSLNQPAMPMDISQTTMPMDVSQFTSPMDHNPNASAGFISPNAFADLMNLLSPSTSNGLNPSASTSVNPNTFTSVLNPSASTSVNPNTFTSVLNPSASTSVLNPSTSTSGLSPSASTSVLNPSSSINVLDLSTSFSMPNPSASTSVPNPSASIHVLDLNASFGVPNPSSSTSVLNPSASTSVLNPSASSSVLNPSTSSSVLNPSASTSVLNPNASTSILNQNTSTGVPNPNISINILNPNSNNLPNLSQSTTEFFSYTMEFLNLSASKDLRVKPHNSLSSSILKSTNPRRVIFTAYTLHIITLCQKKKYLGAPDIFIQQCRRMMDCLNLLIETTIEPCISYEDIRNFFVSFFEKDPNDEELLDNVWKCLKRFSPEMPEKYNPRPLTHLCRCAIRSSLRGNATPNEEISKLPIQEDDIRDFILFNCKEIGHFLEKDCEMREGLEKVDKKQERRSVLEFYRDVEENPEKVLTFFTL